MIERLDDGGSAIWDNFVRGHPDGTFFHLSGWSRVARVALGHRAHYLMARRHGDIVGVLPLTEVRSRLFGHMLLSTGFGVAGGPLAIDQSAKEELLHGAVALAKNVNAGYIELKDTESAQEGWHERSDVYAGFQRDIASDEATCLTQIPRKQRAVVRKALEAGLDEVVDSDCQRVYDLYARTVRDHGTPVFPKRLFQLLMREFASDCDVLTIGKDGVALSSVLSFYYKGRVLPYYTGCLPSARGLGSNDYMYWRLMRRAVERGCTVFDFGRSKIGTGPFAFKKNWGFPPRAIKHQFYLNKRTTIPNLNPTNPQFAGLVNVWRRLPLPVANAIGPFVSRNLG